MQSTSQRRRTRLLSAAAVTACLVTATTAALGSTASIEVARSGSGQGRTIVFIPGLASSAALWDSWAGKLKAHDVHVVGIRGFAGLAPVPGTLTIDRVAADVATYIQREGLEKVIVVGHSVGGVIAQKAAAQTPRIDAILLIDSLPFTAGLFMSGVSPEAAKTQAEAIRGRMAEMSADAFRSQQRAGLHILTRDRAFLATLTEWSETSDQTTVADMYADLLGTDNRAALAALDTRIHVLAAWDPSMPVSSNGIRAIYEAQYGPAGARVALVENSRHFIMVDQPDVFEATLIQVIGE